MAALTPVPKIQFFDANGQPLVGGKLYSYAAGTTTPLVTYTDQAGTSANTNPVILDSRGEASVWLGTGPYKLRLTTATDVDIWTVDDIYSEGALSMSELLSSAGSSLVGFIQSGTGATYRTVQSKLRDAVSVKDFGAVGDGVTDDTAAIQAAINSKAGFLAVYFPAGTYKVTSQITIANDRTTLYGDGAASRILFLPTANAVCFLFENGSNSSVQNVVRDLAFYSTDTTYTKTAIKLIDVSQCLVDNVRTIFPHWHGNTSIFLHVLGRDTTAVRCLNVFADSPIRISPIPAPHVAAGIGIDHFHFSDCYIGNTTSANPLITVDDGVILSNVTFDGYQAWVGGSNGFYWNDTTSSAISFGLTISNARWEQPVSLGGWAVYINRTAANVQQTTFRNIYAGQQNGVWLRRNLYFVLENFVYAGANTASNIDNTNSFGQINLVASNNLATITLNALRQSGQYLLGGNVTVLSASAPSGGGVEQRINPSSTLGFSQLEPKTFTVANGTDIAFSNNTLRGLVFIYSSIGPVSAVMAVNGASNSTKLLTQSDAGWFGITSGAANFNLYWDGGTSTYRLQNTLGSTSTFWVVIVGRGEKA